MEKIVKVEPIQIVYADGARVSHGPTEYGLYVKSFTDRRFKTKRVAKRVAEAIERAIRKALAR